jgi:hypothetical protein
VFSGGATTVRITGKVGQELRRSDFKNCHPRPAESPEDQVVLKVVIPGEPDREAMVGKNDAIICEVLGGAFDSEEFPEADKLRLIQVPRTMENGAVFRFERIRGIVKLSLEYITWD